MRDDFLDKMKWNASDLQKQHEDPLAEGRRRRRSFSFVFSLNHYWLYGISKPA